jgi:integrase
MGIKKDQATGQWIASASIRSPIDGKTISLRRKNLKNEREAKAVHSKLVQEVYEKAKRKAIPTWKVVVEEYLKNAEIRGLGKNTIENMEVCLKAYTYSLWNDRLINDIRSEEIRSIMTVTLAKKSQSYQKSLLKYIRNVFSFALEIGIIDRNPTPKMQFRIGNKLKTVLTEPQARLLLEKARETDHEYYHVWTLALYLGLRSGELYALTWDKVNLDDRKIMIDTSWNSKDGFKSTKSGDDRMVEIAPNLLPFLKELKLQSESKFVLPRIDSWERGRQAEILRAFLIPVGLPRIRFHDLRASWATILLSKGIEPLKVMVMGGWKDLKTMGRYIRKAGVDIKGITDKFELHDPLEKRGAVLSLFKVSDGGEL